MFSITFTSYETQLYFIFNFQASYRQKTTIKNDFHIQCHQWSMSLEQLEIKHYLVIICSGIWEQTWVPDQSIFDQDN